MKKIILILIILLPFLGYSQRNIETRPTTFTNSVAVDSLINFYGAKGNVYLGKDAGLPSIGNNNIGIGDHAFGLALGSNNIGIGEGAANNNIGSNNIAIGAGTCAGNQGSNHIALGMNACNSYTISNVLFINPTGVAKDSTTTLIYGRGDVGAVTINSILNLTPLATAPLAPIMGQIYMDTDTHLYLWNGTSWKVLDN
jgi:hypothetical protein